MSLNYTNQPKNNFKGKTIAFCLPGFSYSGTFMTQMIRLLFDLNQLGINFYISQKYEIYKEDDFYEEVYLYYPFIKNNIAVKAHKASSATMSWTWLDILTFLPCLQNFSYFNLELSD